MTRKPPNGGPRIGPIWAGTISQVIALTNSALDTERSSTSRPIGTIMAPPIPCSDARSDQERQACGKPAQDGAESEQRDGGAENGARPEAVRHLAAHRDEHGKAQQVRGQGDVHVQRCGAEQLRHLRQRRREHGAVELLHEQRAGDDQGDRAVAWFPPSLGGARTAPDGSFRVRVQKRSRSLSDRHGPSSPVAIVAGRSQSGGSPSAGAGIGSWPDAYAA